MFKQSMVAIWLSLSSIRTASAHEGHLEHQLFGELHSHLGWEHVVMMVMIIALALLARKR